MKYYIIDFDYENYPNGAIFGSIGGELKEKEEIVDNFWNYFNTRLPVGFPKVIPQFYFLNYRKARKFLNEDFGGILFLIGLIISDKMKTLVQDAYLPSHIFSQATIKFKEKYFDNYWFFCLTEASIDAIDFNKSYFFIDDGNASITPIKNLDIYADKLIKFDNKSVLYNEMYKYNYPIRGYKIILYNERKYDLINLGSLISPKILFSENVVDKIQSEKMTNCVFKEYILVN